MSNMDKSRLISIIGIRMATRALALASLLALVACSMPVPVHVIEPDSACSRLRDAYPSEHGLVLFKDAAATSATIPWCFPATAGVGMMGYSMNVPVAREGTLTLSMTNMRPPRSFGAFIVDASCRGDATGKIIHRIGIGTSWSMHVLPGSYCITLIPAKAITEDTWFDFTVERP